VAVPVTVGTATRRAVPVQVQAIGNVQPYSTVSVKAEVGGELTRVYFTEGQDVHRDELLFTIDPRPFEAALKQAEANKARDQAQAAYARSDARRYEELYKSGVVAQQQYDQFRTNAEAREAGVQADQAAIETARLQLGYASIRSPINGRTGNLLVQQGNLVKPNDVPLVVINQIQPIYVNFSVPAQYLPDIKQHMASHPLKVEARPKQGSGPPAYGELTFIDNAIDVSTGTILLKGTFLNPDKSLWPGEFVDVTLTLTTEGNAVVVPSQAIQAGQQGQYVFVVKQDLTVESRPVVVSRSYGQQAVVEKGLRPGETVVTDGQLRLAPGAKVSIAGRGTGS
jgi:multidrug efflux system membrane fusion protein